MQHAIPRWWQRCPNQCSIRCHYLLCITRVREQTRIYLLIKEANIYMCIHVYLLYSQYVNGTQCAPHIIWYVTIQAIQWSSARWTPHSTHRFSHNLTSQFALNLNLTYILFFSSIFIGDLPCWTQLQLVGETMLAQVATCTYIYTEWNLSNLGTLGIEESNEVSWFQGL